MASLGAPWQWYGRTPGAGRDSEQTVQKRLGFVAFATVRGTRRTVPGRGPFAQSVSRLLRKGPEKQLHEWRQRQRALRGNVEDGSKVTVSEAGR